MCRRLENLENQSEQLGRAVADVREVEGVREDALKSRLTAIEKGVSSVTRNVQLIRDKQVQLMCLRLKCDKRVLFVCQHCLPTPAVLPIVCAQQ